MTIMLEKFPAIRGKSPTDGLMLSRPGEAVPKKKAKSAQRVVSNYSATLTEVSVLFLRCKANAKV
jgi:hypothetical protein